MKFIKSHWLKFVNLVLILVLGIYVIFFAVEKVCQLEIYHKDTPSPSIYEIWHIETFEGGGKSRITYLKDIARSIENKKKGILFMIKSIDPATIESHLKLSTPHIISFGYGLGSITLPYLIPFNNTYNVRDELVDSGSFDNKLYAIPYIMSGYAMFEHNAESSLFHCGQNKYISPNTIFESMNLSPEIYEDQYDAYKSFVYDKKIQLLGTGRDLYRINNLNNIGRTNAMITPIDTYSDLIQYIGICQTDSIINEFIGAVFSIQNQSKLSEYSLFSSLYGKIYHSGIYNDMENAILNAKVPNAFKK